MEKEYKSDQPATLWIFSGISLLVLLAAILGGAWFVATEGNFSSNKDLHIELEVARNQIKQLQQQLKSLKDENRSLEGKLVELTRKILNYESGLEAKRLELKAAQERMKHEIDKSRLENEHQQILADKIKAAKQVEIEKYRAARAAAEAEALRLQARQKQKLTKQ